MNDMILNMFGALLARKRIDERRSISLREVSEATGIPYKTLYGWQNNTVTRYDAHIMDAVCKYFDCQPGDLFRYEPTNTNLNPVELANAIQRGLGMDRIDPIDAVLTGDPHPDDAPKKPISFHKPVNDQATSFVDDILAGKTRKNE